jgi:preprotein translocase subunit YajC
MDDGQEFEPGDRVSWFGGEGTVLDTKNDDIQVVKHNNEVIELSQDLPMLNMVHEFESGERVSLSDGEGEIIKVEERDGSPDLLYVNMDSGELKKIHADKKELEPVSGISQRLVNGEFDRPEQFNLREWSVQLDLAHRFDRFVSLEGNRIDVVPHQVEAAHEVLTSHDQRHLLAD